MYSQLLIGFPDLFLFTAVRLSYVTVFMKSCTKSQRKDTPMKKHWYLFPVLLVEGGSLMAVELLGAKLVAPFYGNSLYVWTAVLGISVLGLTAGYYFGGILAVFLYGFYMIPHVGLKMSSYYTGMALIILH